MEMTAFSETIKTSTDNNGLGIRFYAYLKMKHMKKARLFVSKESIEDATNQATQYEEMEKKRKQEAQTRQAQNREALKERAKEAAQTVKVGQIFYDSWGYDQTNIDFYQVVKVGGLSVSLRKISGTVTETGNMCGKTVAVPDSFVGEAFTKRIQSYNGKPCFASDYRGAVTPWDGTPLYVSWYA